jgi:hypothetical protein
MFAWSLLVNGFVSVERALSGVKSIELNHPDNKLLRHWLITFVRRRFGRWIDQAVEDERLRIAAGDRDGTVTLERSVADAWRRALSMGTRSRWRHKPAPLRRDQGLPVGDQSVLGEESGQRCQ